MFNMQSYLQANCMVIPLKSLLLILIFYVFQGNFETSSCKIFYETKQTKTSMKKESPKQLLPDVDFDPGACLRMERPQLTRTQPPYIIRGPRRWT